MDVGEDLRRIRSRIESIPESIDPNDAHNELAAQQRAIVRVIEAAGLVPGWSLDRSRDALWSWQSLMQGLSELDRSLPRDADVAESVHEHSHGGKTFFVSPGAGHVWKRVTLAYIDALIQRAERVTPSTVAEGRLWFDEQGHLNHSGSVPLSGFLAALLDQLRQFLARLDSCERSETGVYLLRDARAGNLRGMRVLWDNVVLLAQASIAKTLPGMTPDQREVVKRDGLLATVTAPTRNAQPLADALRQLLFSIPYNADGSWVSEIPSATVAKIRTIGAELIQHQAAWEKSEGRTTQTPTVSVSAALLDRLELGIATVHSIGSNFDAGMARERRVIESLGARDDGPNPANNPKPTRRERRAKWLAQAMLTVRDHPEWSDATIAGKVGINKSRLSRSPEYRAAASMARTPKTPAGSVTVANGDRELEAVDNSFDPNRRASRQWQDEQDTDDRIDREMKETQRKTQRGGAKTPVNRRSGGA